MDVCGVAICDPPETHGCDVRMGLDDNVEMENWRGEGENVEAEIGKSKQGTS